MLTRIGQFLALPELDQEQEKTRVDGLLRIILWVFIVIVAVRTIGFAFAPSPSTLNIAVVCVLMAILVGALFVVRAGYVRGVSIALVVLVWCAAVWGTLRTGGLGGNPLVAHSIVVLVAGLLLGAPAAAVCAGAGAIFGVLFLYLESRGALSFAPDTNLVIGSLLVVAVFCVVAVLVALYQRGFQQMVERARESEAILSDTNRAYEVRIRRLEHLIAQLKGVAEVSRAAVSVHDLETLLAEVTQLIDKLFDFYHLGIFLLSDDGKWAELWASNSEGGRKMLARKHKLGVGQQGIVGYVTSTG